MNATTHWFPGRLTEMSAGECRQLLLGTSVGRVVFLDDVGPAALPVNFVLDGNAVLFRTSPHNSLARHLEGANVAFEVDDFDDYTQSGWSVLVRGVASYVPHGRAARRRGRAPLPLAAGHPHAARPDHP